MNRAHLLFDLGLDIPAGGCSSLQQCLEKRRLPGLSGCDSPAHASFIRTYALLCFRPELAHRLFREIIAFGLELNEKQKLQAFKYYP